RTAGGVGSQRLAKKLQILVRLRSEVVRMPPQMEDAAFFSGRFDSTGDATQAHWLQTLPLRRIRPKKHARAHVAKTVGLRDFIPLHDLWPRQRYVVVQQARRAHCKRFLA